MLRGRFIALQAYLKKQEKSQINNLTLHLKQLEKKEMKNPRVRRKGILKTRADINVRSETIKLLEENIGKTLSDINHSKILYDLPPRILEIKAKMNKWYLINLKSVCTTKETMSKVKS